MGKKGTLFFAGSKATPPQRGLVQLVCITYGCYFSFNKFPGVVILPKSGV